MINTFFSKNIDEGVYKMNVIRKEMFKRMKKYNDEHNIIGAELREKRIKQSKTLDSTVADICSLSYLCKIERNNIIPNKKIINDVCVRLNLEETDVNVLLNLKDLVYNAAVAYLYNDKAKLDKIVNDTKAFNNYRSKIISFISEIFNKKYDIAMELDNEIFKLISTMNNFDLKVFFLFHAILSYYRQAFVEASDYLNSIIELCSLPTKLLILARIYLLKSELKSNNHNINYTYISIKEMLISSGEYDILDTVNFYMCLYFIQNKMFKNYSKLFKTIRNKCNRNSLLIYIKLIFNPKQKINEKLYKNCRKAANLFYHYHKNIDIYYAISENINDSYFDVDLNPIFFQYLSLKNDKDRFDFIVDIASKALYISYDYIIVQYLLDELSNLAYVHSRYKVFQGIYEEFRKLR